jgi:eukaryotic-like serine/threonine-protein kinase
VPGGDDEPASAATLADRPSRRIAPSTRSPLEPDDEATLADAEARAAVAEPASLTTAADAMHNEEVERTRLFIRMGWGISVAALATIPLVDAPRTMDVAFVAALSVGIVVSAWYHRAFADPRRYTARAMLILAVMSLVNAHVAVLYFGTFTVTPLIVVIGIHFVARTEAERAARWIFATAIALYSLAALAIASGAIVDPGVFASDRPLGTRERLVGAGFVLGTYTLAYVTARSFRRASLRSIESLTRATRLASQREALMDELRLDLEHALRAGGPGRYSEQRIGNFRLGHVIGRGAMGEVYDAVHVATGAPAAVKLLRRDLLSDPTHVARFLREVRASAALDSPYVVKLLEASAGGSADGMAATPYLAAPYLAIERLHGESLAEQLRRDGKLALPAVAELIHQVGAGLDVAGGAGIIHRDIKPQNLFHDRVWRILDFGVATLSEENSGTLTQGGIVGTPSYMAPEQAQGKRLDRRADLYALAAVAYRCVTGRHPFSGTDTPALLYAVVHRMPPRPGETVDLPPDVERWFAVGLAKVPADRFATGAELAAAFDAALASALDPAVRRRADALLRALPWA